MNKKRNALTLRLSAWVATVLFGAMVSTANADVLYSQPTFDGADAVFSNFGAGAQNADNFQLGGAVKIDGLRWWGSYMAADSDNFLVRLFSDNGGSPDVLLKEYSGITVSKSSSGLMDIGGGEVFQYDYVLPSLLALSSGKYYLSVMNETLNSEWLWSTGSGGDGANFSRADDADPWDAFDGDFAFQVIGTREQQAVPEPASAALVMMAGACLLLARRRFHADRG